MRTRILEVVASSRGGGAAHVHNLVTGLGAASFDITVAMPEDGGQVTAADIEAAGARFSPLSTSSWQPVWQVRRLIRTKGCDLMHAHGLRAALFTRLALLGLRSRPTSVVTIHGFAVPYYAWPKRTLLLSLERALFPLTDCVICVSAAEQLDYLRATGILPERTRVILNGIDTERFRPGNGRELRQALTTGSAFLVVTVCRLYIPRDFDTLLRAFDALRTDVPAKLWIVGDGPLRPMIEELVQRLDIEKQVVMLGMRRDVPDVLRAADVFVLTSRGWEGLPLTALEAQASGVPVVITDVGGSREAIADGKTGILVPPRDASALYRALLQLARDPGLRAKMGRAGRERAATQFSLQRMARETAAVYEQFLTRRD
ncbi:MAG: glycosyltransferase family 4 protein [Chloroflexi bacterium]|nr:glycosyltransferase family 4 protein [Chloroflexota bacterium]